METDKSAVGTAHWNARMAPGFRFFETNYIFLPANPNSVPFYTHHPLITITFPLQRWIFSVLCLFFPNQQERIQYSNVLPINSYNFVYSLSPVSIIPPFLFFFFWVFLSYSSPITQVFLLPVNLLFNQKVQSVTRISLFAIISFDTHIAIREIKCYPPQ